MIAQMHTLLRIKALKEQEALRNVQQLRRRLDDSCSARQQAQAALDESASTYAAREDAIYRSIIGTIVDQDDIEDTKGRVVNLEKQHGMLGDKLERAIHVEHKIREQLEQAIALHRQATRNRDKFQLIRDDLVSAALAESELREEAEAEELSARPKARLA